MIKPSKTYSHFGGRESLYIAISRPERERLRHFQASHQYTHTTAVHSWWYSTDFLRATTLQQHFFFSHFYSPASRQKPWSQVSSFLPPGFCLQFFIPHGVQQSHCSSIFHRVLLTHALALSAQVKMCTRKSPNEFIRVCTRRGSSSRN